MTHQYPVEIAWRGGRTGSGRVTLQDGSITVPLAVPPEFQGAGGGASPEALLTSSVAACYALTFGIVSEQRRVPVADLQVKATGEVEQEGMRFTFAKVTLRPRITLAPDATDDHERQALDIAHRAEKYCIITNAVRASVAIVLEPEIVRATA